MSSEKIGPMKAWLVEKKGHTPGCKIEPETLGTFRNIGFTVTPMTAVPCPEGLQYGDRVEHRSWGKGTVDGAISPSGAVPWLGDDGKRHFNLPCDLTPIPDEPERTYTEDEWIERTRKALETSVTTKIEDVLARLREQGGSDG